MARRSGVYSRALNKIQAQQKDLATWWAAQKRPRREPVQIERGSLETLQSCALHQRRYATDGVSLTDAINDADDALGTDSLGSDDED